MAVMKSSDQRFFKKMRLCIIMQPCAPFRFEIKDSNGAIKDALGYYRRKQMIGADFKKHN